MGSVFTGLTAKGAELSAKFRQAYVLNKPACHDCWAKFYCSGGCHANAQLFGGGLFTPYEIGCKLQKKRLECAIMIQVSLHETQTAAGKTAL